MVQQARQGDGVRGSSGPPDVHCRLPTLSLSPNATHPPTTTSLPLSRPSSSTHLVRLGLDLGQQLAQQDFLVLLEVDVLCLGIAQDRKEGKT